MTKPSLSAAQSGAAPGSAISEPIAELAAEPDAASESVAGLAAEPGAASGPIAGLVAEPGARSGPVAGAQVGEPAATYPPLRSNRQFQTIWTGSAIATLGLTVADVAYPLAILAVTKSPAQAGLFAAVQAAGMILAGLPAGQLVDRRSPRTVLILAESCRAAVTAVVAAALAFGWLTLPLLLVAAALLGVGQPATSSARMLLVRAAVPTPQLTSALTQDEVRINGADLAGPPLGGALYGLKVLAHAAPFVFTALCLVLSLVSALLTKVSPDRSADPASDGSGPSDAGQPAESGQPADSGRSGMLAGVTAIWGHPVLRATTLVIATINTVGGSLALIAVVILRSQQVPSAIIGIALASGAVGGLAGAGLVKPLHRLRPGVLLITVCLIEVPLLALLAVPDGPWWMAALLFTAMLWIPSIRVLLDVLILRQAPPSERGRVIGAVMTLMGIGIPVGLAASGLMLQYLSARTTMLILAGVLAVGVLYCGAKPQLWHAKWPQ